MEISTIIEESLIKTNRVFHHSNVTRMHLTIRRIKANTLEITSSKAIGAVTIEEAVECRAVGTKTVTKAINRVDVIKVPSKS